MGLLPQLSETKSKEVSTTFSTELMLMLKNICTLSLLSHLHSASLINPNYLNQVKQNQSWKGVEEISMLSSQ